MTCDEFAGLPGVLYGSVLFSVERIRELPFELLRVVVAGFAGGFAA